MKTCTQPPVIKNHCHAAWSINSLEVLNRVGWQRVLKSEVKRGEQRWTEVTIGWKLYVCHHSYPHFHIFSLNAADSQNLVTGGLLSRPWCCCIHVTSSNERAERLQLRALGDVPFVFCRSVMICVGDVKHGDQAKSWMEFVCSCHCWPLLTPFSCKFLEPAASAASSPIFGPWIFSQQN